MLYENMSYTVNINGQNMQAVLMYSGRGSTGESTLSEEFIKRAEKETVLLVQALFKGRGKWNETNEYNLKRFLFLFHKLNEIWNVNTNVNIDFSPSAISSKHTNGGGCYMPNFNTIQLVFPSVMTALHEWKHRLQHVYPDYKPSERISIDRIIEPDAIMWSHAIFKLALPKMYERNIVDRKFFQIPNVLFPLKIFDRETLDRINNILNTEGIKIYSQEGSLLASINLSENR